MLFFLALILYITSLVAGLIFFIAGKNLPAVLSRTLIILHLGSILLLLIHLLAGSRAAELPLIFHLSLLAFVCTGLMACGFIYNGKGIRLVKIYFIIFPLTFPLFLFKPSLLIHFLINMEVPAGQQRFLVKEPVYLEKQQTQTGGDSTGSFYKLIARHGLFTRTLVRDIKLPADADSVHNLFGEKNKTVSFRAYFNGKSGTSDSSDITIQLPSP